VLNCRDGVVPRLPLLDDALGLDPGSISSYPPLYMHTFTSPVWIVLLAILFGGLNVFSPDRWLPASVLAWQKGWKISRTISFLGIALFSHVLTGYLLFLLFQNIGNRIGQKFSVDMGASSLFLFALGLMFFITLARRLRFPRIQEAFRVGQKGAWGSFIVFSLLGPCEVIVPIFVKAKSLGVGYLIPFLAFLTGTWITGIGLVAISKTIWNRPLGLPQGVDWAYRKCLALPVFTCLTLTLGFSLI